MSSWNPPDVYNDSRDLRLSNDDRVVAGVCGGVGRYIGIDALWVRVGAVALTLMAGVGVVAYLAAMIFIPRQRPGDNVGPSRSRRSGHSRHSGKMIVGVVLVAVGAMLLLQGLLHWFSRLLLPLAIVAIGVALFSRAFNNSRR